MEERCDQIIDCNDESDEDNCKLLVFKKSYKKKVPPITIDTEDKYTSHGECVHKSYECAGHFRVQSHN